MTESGRDGSTGETGAIKSHRLILEEEIALAEEELQRPVRGLATSGFIAGFGIGVSVLLIAAMLDQPGGITEPPSGLLIGSAYAVGFVIVILSRTDLFTEYTTLAILPVLTGKATTAQLVRLWALVFLGNIAGAGAFAMLLAWLGPALGTVQSSTLIAMAEDLVRVDAHVMFVSAILAGWLMGLLSWLIAAARETVSQIIFIWLIALVIGVGHLHHSIVGSAEILAALPLSTGITVADYSFFLLWTTTGNAAGGVVFAVLIRLGMVVGGGRAGHSRRSSPSAGSE